MNNAVLSWLLGGATAYLLGSIPFGYLIARARGVDIRAVGSCSIGATNVFRCVGKPWGIATFILDLAKGIAGCRLIPWLALQAAGAAGDVPAAEIAPLHVGCGVLAVIGHNWPVFLGFRGGKGIATSAGLLLGLAPLGCAIGLLAWIPVMAVTRIVSLASIAAAVTLGMAAWPLYGATGAWFPVVLDALAALAIVRHRANIARMLSGTEPRVSFRKPPPAG